MANRQLTLPGIWAESAEVVIPSVPVKGTTYRDQLFSSGDIDTAWPNLTIVDSAKFNQMLYLLTSLMQQLEHQGVLTYSENLDYTTIVGAVVMGSNGQPYKILQDNGPGTAAGVKDPTTEPTYWSAI